MMGVCAQIPNFVLLCGLIFGPLQTEAVEGTSCIAGYTHVSGTGLCIKVHASKSKSWDAARNRCQRKGADLLTIHDLDTFNALKSVIPERTNFWIGMNDKATEGNYVWLDETTRATFHNLNLHSQFTRNAAHDDCILLMTQGSYQWYMHPCSNELPWICSYAA